VDGHDATEPEVLYHYTDAAGLFGIVASPNFPDGYAGAEMDFSGAIKLLASDVRFMNDHAELRFAGKIFAKRFRQVAEDQEVPQFRRELLTQFAKELEDRNFLGEPVQLFAACLSSEGDQLSQWRGYAGGSGGYSIGIPKLALDHFSFAFPLHPSAGLIAMGEQPALLRAPVKVSYDEPEAVAAADRLAHEIQPGGPETMDSAFWARWRAVEEMARFKDKGFREEQEWRMIWYHAPSSTSMSVPAEFRQGRFGIVPCLSIAINPAGLSRVPDLERVWGPRPERTIEKLVVGPSPDQTLRVSAARQLLETNGHDPSVVVPSPIPFRG
jgi:hypothetical protein